MSNTIACILLNSKLSSISGFSLIIKFEVVHGDRQFTVCQQCQVLQNSLLFQFISKKDSLFVSNVRYFKTHYSFQFISNKDSLFVSNVRYLKTHYSFSLYLRKTACSNRVSVRHLASSGGENLSCSI